MDARGFGAGKHRTSIVRLEVTRLDRVLCVLALVALAVLVTLRVPGVGVLVRGTL